jgi:hypothetical protein
MPSVKYHGIKAYSSVLNMGASHPSESLVNSYQTTRRHIPEDVSLNAQMYCGYYCVGILPIWYVSFRDETLCLEAFRRFSIQCTLNMSAAMYAEMEQLHPWYDTKILVLTLQKVNTVLYLRRSVSCTMLWSVVSTVAWWLAIVFFVISPFFRNQYQMVVILTDKFTYRTIHTSLHAKYIYIHHSEILLSNRNNLLKI